MATNKLTEIAINQAKPAEKPFKMTDGGGMYLLVDTKGGKYWRLDYRFAEKRKTLALGVYPEMSLKEARKARDDARKKIDQGVDPCEQRKVSKLTAAHHSSTTFEAVAREWHKEFSPNWTKHTQDKNLSILVNNAFPWIGARPIDEVTAPELLAVIRRVKDRGYLDSAHRLRMTAGQVFRYAITTGRCERDISAYLRGAIPTQPKKHYAAITDPEAFGALLRDIWAYQGSLTTCSAFRLSALFGLRPGEVRNLEWAEVDLPGRLIRIPLGKMKARRLHVVPLAEQAAAILEELKPLTESGKYCFPGLHNRDRPMSENTINAALRRLGYDTQSEQSAHGFRSSFSTMAHGSGLRLSRCSSPTSTATQHAWRMTGVISLKNAASSWPGGLTSATRCEQVSLLYSDSDVNEIEARLYSSPCSIRVLDSYRKRLSTFDYELLVVQILDIGAINYCGFRYGKKTVKGICSDISSAANTLLSLKNGFFETRRESNLWSKEIDDLGFLLEKIDHSVLLKIRLVAESAVSAEFQEIVRGYDSGKRKNNPLRGFVTGLDHSFSHQSIFNLSHAEMAGIAWAVLDKDDKSPIQNTYESASVDSNPAKKDQRSEQVRKIRESLRG